MRATLRLAALAFLLATTLPAQALTFVLGAALPQVYLRVGATGGTVSVVTFDLSGSQAILGSGTPIYGTVAATAGAANAETANFPACPADHVRIVARVRSFFFFPITGTLQVTSSAGLTHAATGNTIPFTQIGWDSDDATEFGSGTFSGGTQALAPTIPFSRETGACHRFKFLNTAVFPASVGGTGYYQGNVTYNLTAQ